MSWGRLEDSVSINRKLAELNDRERRMLGDGLWAYCARERNGGYFDEREVRHVFYLGKARGRTSTAHLTHTQLARFVQLGLVDDLGDGQYKVHNWERYQPKDPTATERKRRQRAKEERDSTVTVTDRDNRDSHERDNRDSRARVPVPSRKNKTKGFTALDQPTRDDLPGEPTPDEQPPDFTSLNTLIPSVFPEHIP